MRYAVIDVDGTIEVLQTKALTRGVIMSHIGQDFEGLPTPEHLNLSVFGADTRTSPDGQRLRMNTKATHLLQDAMWPGDHVVGPVVISGPADEDGESTDLDPSLIGIEDE